MHKIYSQLKNRLSDSDKVRVRKLLQLVLAPLPTFGNLAFLSCAYGSDKFGHGYVGPYSKFFRPFRMKRMKIMEIGVGGYCDPKAGGASLRMWKKYFPLSQIFGIDFYDKSTLEESRISIFQGDQSDPVFLHNVAEKIGPIDIIIDDGSHINEHVKISFRTLFPFLKAGGFYVIEDLQTSYRPDMGGDAEDLNNAHTSMAMLKDLLDGINHKYIPGRIPTYYDSNIRSIHFYPKLVLFQKGNNS